MSQEKVLKTLASLGLTDWDAKVYILLAKRGPIKAGDAAKALKISRQRLYLILKNLQSKGIINSTLERPARFTAVEFEKVLDSFLKARMEQTRRIQQKKDEILSDWQSITVAENESSPAKFTIIEGRFHIYSKIQQMIEDTRKNLSFVATVPSLARADQFGLFDATFNHPLKSKIRFRFLSELSDQNASAMKALLRKIPKTNLSIEGKTPDLGLKLCPRMIIRDGAEAVFFIDPKEGELASEQDDVCLWTNCKSLVNGFLAMFEDLWSNATDIEKKIVEFETPKAAPKTRILNDAKIAYDKYIETLKAAKEHIILITSTKGVIDYSKCINLVKQLVERGVSIEIMAPITGKNMEAIEQLLKICEVRNVPPDYQETTIIDGKHLFQFKNPPQNQEKTETNTCFENTSYTYNHEYVDKTKNMLASIWKTAFIPSLQPHGEINRLLSRGKMTKSDVDLLSDRKSIVGLTHVRLTLNMKTHLTVCEKVSDNYPVKQILTKGLIWDVELAIENKPTLVGKAICEREVVNVPQKHAENKIIRDYYEISFPEGGGFKGNALIILENFTPEAFWEKSKAYALFKGTGKFEGQTLNVGHPWQSFSYPIVWTGYLLKP